jgi:tetratricopeptide (TPR) repeat protein
VQQRWLTLGLMLGASLGLTGCLTTTPENHANNRDLSQIAPSAPAAAVSNGDSLLHMADAMANEGAYTAAIPLYRRAYQKSGHSQALIGLGRALTASGEYLEAIKVFKAAGADNSNALRGMANAYTALDQPGDALPLLDKALTQNPADTDALSSKAVALDLLGRYDDAAALYEQGLKLDPEHAGLRHNYGLALALTGTDLPRALELLRAATAKASGSPAERQTLALAYALAGNDTAASHLLSIDLGGAETTQKLAYFQLIKAMPTGQRFNAVIAANLHPKHDLTAPANRAFAPSDDIKAVTTTRVLQETAPPAIAASAVEAKPEPATPEAKVPDNQSPPAETSQPVTKHLKLKAHSEASSSELTDNAFPKDWSVQIAAYRHTNQADKGWKILSARYKDIIGTFKPDQYLVDFGDREKKPKGKFYRLVSGPMKSRAEAVAVCEKLQEKGAECIVRPPHNPAS